MNKPRIIMVGPDLAGFGGISRVVSLWRSGGYFEENRIDYFASVPERGSRALKLLVSFVRVFYACLGGCRAVYIHTASYNSFYRKCLFMVPAILFKRPLILHIHPSYFSQFLSELRGIKRRVTWTILSKVEFFVVLSASIQHDVSVLFPGKPVHILNNPIDIERMANISGIERKQNHVLFLGWYIQRKGVYELVDALEMMLKDNVEVSADFFGTKEQEALYRYVANRGLQETIRINGWIGEQEKVKALYGCTMLVLPSHTEGVPNVILEAMATKTPIVSTLVGGLKDFLRDGENAVIAEPQNAIDIRKKIQTILQHPELAERLAETAYREACLQYDLPVIKKRFEFILDSI
jgi:glycosyltransferase involved in cell wall biosynthesis